VRTHPPHSQACMFVGGLKQFPRSSGVALMYTGSGAVQILAARHMHVSFSEALYQPCAIELHMWVCGCHMQAAKVGALGACFNSLWKQAVCAPDPARARPHRCLGGSAPRCVDASAAQVAANLAELLRRELEADRAENQRNRSLALIRSVDAHCEALMFVSARPAPGAWHILHVNERAAAVCGAPRAAPRAQEHRKRSCRKALMLESANAGGCRSARLARSGVCSDSV